MLKKKWLGNIWSRFKLKLINVLNSKYKYLSLTSLSSYIFIQREKSFGFHEVNSLLIKLDGVGPVDDRPSTD